MPRPRASAASTNRGWLFFSSRRRHTRCLSDWSSDVCSSDLGQGRSAVAVSGTQVGKTLTVIGGNSIDRVGISGTTTQEDLNVEVKKGDDQVRLVNRSEERRVGKAVGRRLDEDGAEERAGTAS